MSGVNNSEAVRFFLLLSFDLVYFKYCNYCSSVLRTPNNNKLRAVLVSYEPLSIAQDNFVHPNYWNAKKTAIDHFVAESWMAKQYLLTLSEKPKLYNPNLVFDCINNWTPFLLYRIESTANQHSRFLVCFVFNWLFAFRFLGFTIVLSTSLYTCDHYVVVFSLLIFCSTLWIYR